MIPLRDENPSGTFPFFTILLVLGNVLAFLYEMQLPEAHLNATVFKFGVVPARAMEQLKSGPAGFEDLILPFFSSMFLHGSIMHLLGNVWYLWLFGDNIEDRLGHFRFLIFYLVCGLLAGGAQVAVDPASTVPCIGASGAIAGVLGAYFFCYPGARVLTLIPIFFFFTTVYLPAWILLGLWFVIQVMSGTSTGADAGGVAWWAHIGGFVAGVALIILMPRNKKARQRERLDRFQTYRHRRLG